MISKVQLEALRERARLSDGLDMTASLELLDRLAELEPEPLSPEDAAKSLAETRAFCGPRRTGAADLAASADYVAARRAMDLRLEASPMMCTEPLDTPEVIIGAAMALDRIVLAKRDRERRARERMEDRMRTWAPALRFALRCLSLVKGLRETIRQAWASTGTLDGLIVRRSAKPSAPEWKTSREAVRRARMTEGA